MKLHTLLLVGLGGLVIAGCHSGHKDPETSSDRQTVPVEKTIGMANPASVYCLTLGGKEINITTDLGVHTDCLLPSGERIDEWTLYRRDHS